MGSAPSCGPFRARSSSVSIQRVQKGQLACYDCFPQHSKPLRLIMCSDTLKKVCGVSLENKWEGSVKEISRDRAQKFTPVQNVFFHLECFLSAAPQEKPVGDRLAVLYEVAGISSSCYG